MGLHDGLGQRCKRRYLAAGAEGMDDHQLLELLLFFAIPRQDTNETAHRLVRQFGSMQGSAARLGGRADDGGRRGRERRRAAASGKATWRCAPGALPCPRRC